MPQTWEQYIRDQEMPETCPSCGCVNTAEDGSWLCTETPGFCSVACQHVYVTAQKEDAQKQVEEWEELQRLFAKGLGSRRTLMKEMTPRVNVAIEVVFRTIAVEGACLVGSVPSSELKSDFERVLREELLPMFYAPSEHTIDLDVRWDGYDVMWKEEGWVFVAVTHTYDQGTPGQYSEVSGPESFMLAEIIRARLRTLIRNNSRLFPRSPSKRVGS